jgi:hypothetical protein
MRKNDFVSSMKIISTENPIATLKITTSSLIGRCFTSPFDKGKFCRTVRVIVEMVRLLL